MRKVLLSLFLVVAGLLMTASPANAAKVSTALEKFELDEQGNLVLRFIYTPRVLTAKSGSVVQFASAQGAHTWTAVRAADVPDTIEEVFGCFAPVEVCGKVLGQHRDGEVRVVNVGQPGFNTAGDSRFVPEGERLSVKVTARPGTTLHYICAIHPWMDASIRVT
jgi:plastocyanin